MRSIFFACKSVAHMPTCLAKKKRIETQRTIIHGPVRKSASIDEMRVIRLLFRFFFSSQAIQFARTCIHVLFISYFLLLFFFALEPATLSLALSAYTFTYTWRCCFLLFFLYIFFLTYFQRTFYAHKPFSCANALICSQYAGLVALPSSMPSRAGQRVAQREVV